MMSLYLFVKTLHILGACVLLGTGAGIAFFMLMAHRTRDARLIAQTASIVILADWIFTASAVVLQPITGVALAKMANYPVMSGWVGLGILLYLLVGACWLPVVAIQIRLRALARTAAEAGAELPPRYDALFRLWLILGCAAFALVLGVLGLMVFKPYF